MKRETPRDPTKGRRGASHSTRVETSYAQHMEAWRLAPVVHQDPLERYERAFRAGSYPALYEALRRCRDRNIPVPDWAIDGSMRAIELLSPLNRPKRRGRGQNPILRFRQDLIHAARYSLVLEIREKQLEARQELQSLRDCGASQKEIELAEQFCKRMGRTWDDAYELASETLRGSVAFAGAPTMKKSYLHVKGFEKVPGASPKFMFVGPETLARLGIERFG